MGLNKRLIGAGATASGALTPSENFKAVTYTGNGGTQAITGVGFQPDFVWCKARSQAHDHNVTDSTRGVSKGLNPNTTAVEGNQAPLGVTAFGTDGFTVVDNSGGGASVNGSGITYVAWCWKAGGGTTASNSDGSITSTVQANQAAGFSIVTWTGNGSAGATVGHGLGVAPGYIILKNRTRAGYGWYVLTSTGATHNMVLNTTDAQATSTAAWNDTQPTSTVFSLGSDTGPNSANYPYVGYCFSNIDGFSKAGTYTGNGSANGPIVETGFEPAFIMIKSTAGGQDWRLYDNKRNASNPRNCYLSANNSNAEECQYDQVDFLSNGFKVIGTDGSLNGNGTTITYLAFAADPDTEAPTLASSFNVETYTGTGAARSISGLGFGPGLVWTKDRGNAEQHQLHDIVRGATKAIASNLSNAEATRADGLTSFDSDGFSLGSDGAGIINDSSRGPYVAWTWKADDNEPTIFPPNQTVADIKSTNLTLNLNLAAGSYSGSGTDLIDLSAAGEDFSRSSAGNIKEGFGGYYIDLEGNDQYWTSDSSVATTTGNDITIEFWVRSESPSQYSYANIIDANHGTAVSGSTGNGWVIQQRGSNYNSYYFYYYNGTGGESNSDSELFTLTNNEWTHIAIVKSGTNIQVYKNGSAGNSWTAGSATLANPNQKVRLGQWLDSDSRGFGGSLAQVRFYSDALSSSEVTANYNATKNLFQLTQSLVSANANAGMSIVKYTSTGASGSKVSHGLSATPNMILIKCTSDGSTNWIVHHSSLGNSKYLTLNDDSVQDTSTNWLVPSATTFALNQTFGNANTSGRQYVAYCFHDIAGYQKFGGYSGSGSAVTVTTGFKPDFIMIRSTASENWNILDTRRGFDKRLYPDLTNAETDETSDYITITSTSFTVTVTGNDSLNNSGRDYIYWAVAKNVPSNTTLANSFGIKTWTGNDNNNRAITGLGFRPDFVWIKRRSSSEDYALYDSVRGANEQLSSNTTAAEVTNSATYNGLPSFDSDGFSVGNNGGTNRAPETYVGWAWKAGNTWQSNIDGTIGSTVNANTANGFSIVKYVGDGNSARTVGHGLTAKCDLVIIKGLDSADKWVVQLPQLGDNARMVLEGTAAKTDDSTTAQAGNTTVFGIGGDNAVNKSGDEFIAYCWHSVSGYSKISSYTGNGSTQSITGLGFQPDWVLIKETSAAESWRVFDSVRGATERLFPDTNGAESTGSDSLTSFDSDGFSLGSSAGVNENTQTYIYMAFKMN